MLNVEQRTGMQDARWYVCADDVWGWPQSAVGVQMQDISI